MGHFIFPLMVMLVGGLDIFKATFDADNNNLRSVDNMKSPINSSNDDFGIILKITKKKVIYLQIELEVKVMIFINSTYQN